MMIPWKKLATAKPATWKSKWFAQLAKSIYMWNAPQPTTRPNLPLGLIIIKCKNTCFVFIFLFCDEKIDYDCYMLLQKGL